MKVLVPTAAAALLFAGAAHAQTAPQTPPARSASDLTRDLNSGPPTIEEYLARPPAAPTPAPAPAAATPAPSLPASPPLTVEPAPRPAPIPSAPAPQPRMEPITPTPPPAARIAPIPPASSGPTVSAPPPGTIVPRPVAPPAGPAAAPRTVPPAAPTPAPVPAPAPDAAEPAPPPVPAVTVLDAPARAALPFMVELPAGFEIVTGRPGPDFRIYTIRRGERSFVMVYAGPASQFPIYSGQMVEAGGRASVVVDETGARHAVEHLFQRPEGATPREIHVWTMTLDGPDRALAEQIAQSVDVR